MNKREKEKKKERMNKSEKEKRKEERKTGKGFFEIKT
jgi:hypothetical protein